MRKIAAQAQGCGKPTDPSSRGERGDVSMEIVDSSED